MSVTSKDIHVALGVNDRYVAITGRWLSASNQAKFVFVILRSIMVDPAKFPLLHRLVVLVEAMVSVLNNERVHHCNRRRSA